jgi:sugar phosphate isomerase/epimerase
MSGAATPLHPRVSVNAISSIQQTLAEDVALWQRLGIDHVGLILHKVEATGWAESERMLREAGLRVSTIAGPVPVSLRADPDSDARRAEQAVIARALELAAAVGAPTMYLCSGPADGLTWDDAAASFCAGVIPSVERAEALGVRLAIEPTNPLRADVSFVFGFADAVDLATSAGIGVVADFQSCWYERGIDDRLRAHIDRVALVQVSDYVVGSFDTPNRAVPGDGVVPIERMLGAVVDAGYDGPVDIEVIGPRIEAEGYAGAIGRSAAYVSELLDRLEQ